MTALLSPYFWFNPAPTALMPFMQTGFIVLFTAMTVLGVVAYVVRFRLGLEKLTRRALERAGNCLVTCGLLGLTVVATTYERIPVLSMRVLFLAVFALFGYWAYKIYQYVWVEIPKIKANRQQQEEYNKWLPKKKK